MLPAVGVVLADYSWRGPGSGPVYSGRGSSSVKGWSIYGGFNHAFTPTFDASLAASYAEADDVSVREAVPVSQGDWTLNGTYTVNTPSGDYVYLPGIAANYISHPDSAAVSVTGDITLQVEVALDDWTAQQTRKPERMELKRFFVAWFKI